jgi:anti-sigma B factor antagonist
MGTPMTVSECHVGDVTLLELKGRLVYDEGDAPVAGRISGLVAEQQLKIVLSLADVTSLDSSGIGMLVSKLVSVRKRGGDIKLLHLSPRVHRVMEVARLLDIFETYDSEAAAVGSFSSRLGA